MIRYGFRRLATANELERDSKDTPFKGMRLTFLTPFISVIVLLPWILSGAFDSDDLTTGSAIIVLLVAFYCAILVGGLVLAFVVTPIELVIRGSYAALVTKDKTKVGYLYMGGYILLALAFIVTLSLGVNSDHSGLAAAPAFVAALVGIPADYVINSEASVWTARGLAILFLGLLVSGFIKPKSED